jgi:hypothetical protein
MKLQLLSFHMPAGFPFRDLPAGNSASWAGSIPVLTVMIFFLFHFSRTVKPAVVCIDVNLAGMPGS